MAAYERAHAWRELFAIAVREQVDADELNDMCERVSGKSGHRIKSRLCNAYSLG